MTLKDILLNLPEVAGPTQKKLGFQEKLKWTLLILVLFFIMGIIPLFGLGENALAQFEYLSIILGAEFGSIISLGIGPLVTASIVLQLLNGSGILNFDTKTPDGKRLFQGTQKIVAVFFIIFEAIIYVMMGGLSPGTEFNPVTQQFTASAIAGTTLSLAASMIFSLKLLLILQLFVGGLMIMLMDEIISKWGFGSGISLFIVAGVSKSLFVRAFSWISGPDSLSGEFAYASGKIPQFFQALYNGDPQTAITAAALVITTIIVFGMAVYLQSMKIEIPLSFGRIRGHGIRWPLSFAYASNIPVILISALLANLQLWAGLLQKWGYPLLGEMSGGAPISGIVSWVAAPGGANGLVGLILTQGTLFIGFRPYLQGFVYMIIIIIGCVVFSYFWVQTAGMDAKSQAKNMVSSGLQIPGFRKDERILERLLERYITPLTIMGGATIGFLAAIADVLGSLTQGTSLLLSVMIIYRLYEEIAKDHMMDMYPALRKIME